MNSPIVSTLKNGSEIAIIGLTGRFPGAKNIDEFWNNLQNGIESVSFFTDEELLLSGVSSSVLSDSNYVKAGSTLEDVEFFDASFFGFNPREAEITDPQHRLFLECAWEALESAGYDSETYKGTVGVYAGSSLSSYLLSVYLNQNIIDSINPEQLMIAGDKDFLTTRVSYKLNLEGPSYTVQTACSTSLVAIHLACQSLLNVECDIALAGGVSISASRKAGYFYTEGGILSPDGHCRAFDTTAQGTVSGEGVGIVVLKRLEEALADGDCIHAVIKGSAINNDGSFKVSYTAPRIDTQAKVIRTAQIIAEVEPETITYIEAHGTGTPLGDPIEVAALTQAFRSSTQKKGFCAIGSVKTNIGHLDAAAGVTGLIKTTLALKHKQIPASLHFQEPSPQIDFVNSPFYVNNSLSDWKANINGIPRRAGVSSFGIGGTNAHAILEEAPVVEPSGSSRPWQLLLFSAKTSTAIETVTTNIAAHLQQHTYLNLADVAYTLQVGRRAFNHRRMVVCQDIDDAVKVLSNQDPQRVFTHYEEPCNRPVVFMFSGQGAQYVNMGRELYQSEPIFKEQVDECCQLLKPHIGLDLRTVLYPSEQQAQQATQQLLQTAITQPALFVIEYALAQLWMVWGVQPEAMIGHSIGEYVAATLAGVFSLEDALALVAQRGKLMQQLPTGAMLSVQLPEHKVRPLLEPELSLAASNSPSYCVVSGSTEAVEKLQQQLQEKGAGCRRLHTSHAFHSQMMEPIIDPYTQNLQKVKLNPPQIPFVSNVSGTWITTAEATDPNYWARHLRQPVRFSEGIAELFKQPKRIFLEVGPGRTLSTFTKQHQQEELVALTSLRHPQDQQSDVAFLLHTLGRLWLFGVQIDWSCLYTHEWRHRIPLPTYPFERQRYWIEPQGYLGQVTKDRGQSNKLLNSLLWKSLVKAGQTQACAGIKEFDEQTYLANKQCLEGLCTVYINLGLKRLGAFSNPNKKYSIEELFEQCQIIPRYRQLLCRWLNVLVEQGQLQKEQGLFTNLVPFSTDALNGLLEEVKVRFADTPQVVDTVQQCGENLASVLTGKQEPLELYVASLQKRAEQTAEDSNQKLPLYDYCKGIIQASLEQVVKLLPTDVNLRILEIGGGNGIATEVLLPILPSKQTNYTFTDVGGLLVQLAQQKFSAYPFVEYRLLDIEQPPSEQGYSRHSFDVVVAVNVLHVTLNMAQTLEHVRSLLAPGGFFLLWEITQPQIEFDMTDGLLMNPLEDEERSQGNPFLSKDQWQKALRDHGFVEVVALSETEAFGHDVLVAQAPALVDLSAPSAFTVLIEQKNADQMRQVSSDKKPDLADWFYIPSWKRSMPPQPLDSKVQATQPGCWLVFADECGLGEKMVQRIELDGHEVITVKVGEQFSRKNKLSQRAYTINPRQRDDYDVLFKELLALNKTPNRIVHLWSVTPNLHAELSIESLEKSEYLDFYSLLFLTQALYENNQTHSLEIAIVSNNMQEVTGSEALCPEKALVLGPCKVIPLEYPNITCRSIDIVIPSDESRQEEQLIEALLNELYAQTSDQVIAYRGHHRWVQDFQPIRLDGKVEGNPRLRAGGVYLITGGLGGIGLALAEYIAQTVHAKLILLGRSAFPDRDEWPQWLSTHDKQDSVSCKIQKLQIIEALGAEVMVLSADVANAEQMSAVIKKANQQFGQINGVIHAAAVTGGGMIQLKTKEAAASALAPKVAGTIVLDVLLKDAKLDFFVLCSSLNSFCGTPGMVDYTAENTFLDAFAHHSVYQHNRFTISINWDRWNNLGMSIAVEARHKQLTGEAVTAGMTLSEGIEAFRRILCNSTVSEVIVSTQDFQASIQPQDSVKSLEKELVQLSRAKQTHPRPNLGNAYVAPSNEVEQTVADIWQQLLGIEQVGIHDNFFELGGDSLFATMLISRLCKTFEVELPYQSFFKAPTIVQLAEAIIQKLTEQSDQDVLAAALADIEQLSKDEVQTLLASQEQLIEVRGSNE
ncbi:MAG: beta-ketoacyl synthase N-terminal-like domain-containing protein [Nostoc sp. S4]|nr:beta-ketoacyl synthase N-terminal-like domain-containing protein [Nostoc sp. S4]